MIELMPRGHIKTTTQPEEAPSEAGLTSGVYYANLSGEQIPENAPTEIGKKAAEIALAEIRGRSFSGRHPELGKMINCQFCGFRHRENERKCEQKFAEKDSVVYGELKPPEGLTQLTKKQILGAAAFAKCRLRPHSNRYLQARTNALAAKQRKEEHAKKV